MVSKEQIISNTIIIINKFMFGTITELIAIANLFNSKTQRLVKQTIPLKKEYWIKIK